MDLSTFDQNYIKLEKKGQLSYYQKCIDDNFPYLVLLPGSFSPAQQYSEIVAHLDDTMNVVVLEYRGHGLSWPPFKKGSIPLITQDVIKVLDALSIKSTFVAGHSIGGMVAIDLAGTIPDRIKGVISIEGWTNHNAQQDAYGNVLNPTLTAEQIEVRQTLRESVLKSWKNRQRRHFASFWRNWDGFMILKSTKIPILEIYGDRGMEIPPTHDQLKIPQRKNISLKIIHNGAHSMPIQFPLEIAKLISRFIEDQR